MRAIAFDKTGTLTTGILQVSDRVPAPGISADRVLQLAASLEACSDHPIAQAVVELAQCQEIELLPTENVYAEVGQGIAGHLATGTVRIGKLSFVTTEQTLLVDPMLLKTGQRLEAEGKTVIWAMEQDQVIGLLAVADRVRRENGSAHV